MIETVDDLHEHLRIALRLELSTVPLYLYALQSIEDQRCDAAGLIRSVVAEEMLHFALVANLLLATGGEPDLLAPDLRPTYPSELLHHVPPLTLNLAPATIAHVRDTFLAIEQPDPVGSPGEPGVYDSLGEFYATVAAGIERLGDGLFVRPQVERQLSDPRFYGAVAFNVDASGDLMVIDGPASARAAIDVIVHQGEGLSDDRWADPGQQELTHYAKFQQLVDGTTPIGASRPLPENPRAAAYPEGARLVSDLFNAVYASLFVLLAALYEPRPTKGGLVGRLYTAMTGILAPLGRELGTIPIGDGLVAGPTFEPYDLGPDPAARLADLAAAVVAQRPTLATALAPLLERRLVGQEARRGLQTPSTPVITRTSTGQGSAPVGREDASRDHST